MSTVAEFLATLPSLEFSSFQTFSSEDISELDQVLFYLCSGQVDVSTKYVALKITEKSFFSIFEFFFPEESSSHKNSYLLSSLSSSPSSSSSSPSSSSSSSSSLDVPLLPLHQLTKSTIPSSSHFSLNRHGHVSYSYEIRETSIIKYFPRDKLISLYSEQPVLFSLLLQHISEDIRRFNGQVNQALSDALSSTITPQIPQTVLNSERYSHLLQQAIHRANRKQRVLTREKTKFSTSPRFWSVKLHLREPGPKVLARLSPTVEGLSISCMLFDIPCRFHINWKHMIRVTGEIRRRNVIKLEFLCSDPDQLSKPRCCVLILTCQTSEHQDQIMTFIVDSLRRNQVVFDKTEFEIQVLSSAPPVFSEASSLFELNWYDWSMILSKVESSRYSTGQILLDSNPFVSKSSLLFHLSKGVVSIETAQSLPPLVLGYVASPGLIGEMSFCSQLLKPDAVVRAHSKVVVCLVVSSGHVLRRLKSRPMMNLRIQYLLTLMKARRSPPALVASQLRRIHRSPRLLNPNIVGLEQKILPSDRSALPQDLPQGSAQPSLVFLPQTSKPIFRYTLLSRLIHKDTPQLDKKILLHTHRYLYLHHEATLHQLSDFSLLEFLSESFALGNKQSILEVIDLWLEIGIQHQNMLCPSQIQEFQSKLEVFLTDGSVQSMTETSMIRSKINAYQSETFKKTVRFPKWQRVDSPLNILGLDFDDFKALEIVQILTLIEWELFVTLPLGELLSGRFMKNESSPHLRLLISHFNKITTLLCSAILHRSTAVARSQLIDFWISVADHSFKIGNFSLVLQVVSALQSTSISRMKSTWALVPRKSLKIFAQLQTIVNPLDNYSTYRSLTLIEKRRFLVPVLPIYQKDLTFLEHVIEESMTKVGSFTSLIDSGVAIPWDQIHSVGMIIENLRQIQLVEPFLSISPHLINLLLSLIESYKVFSESEQYFLSALFEPFRSVFLADLDRLNRDSMITLAHQSVVVTLAPSKDLVLMVKRVLGSSSPSITKVLNLKPLMIFRDIRNLFIEKLVAFCSPTADLDRLRGELNQWRFHTGENCFAEEEKLEADTEELTFRPMAKDYRRSATLSNVPIQMIQDRLTRLEQHVEETRITFGKEIQDLHSLVHSLHSSLDKLTFLLQNTLKVDTSSIYDEEDEPIDFSSSLEGK